MRTQSLLPQGASSSHPNTAARPPPPPAPPEELPSSSSARSGRRRESEGSGLMPPPQELRVWAKWVKPYGSSAGFSVHCRQRGGGQAVGRAARRLSRCRQTPWGRKDGCLCVATPAVQLQRLGSLPTRCCSPPRLPLPCWRHPQFVCPLPSPGPAGWPLTVHSRSGSSPSSGSPSASHLNASRCEFHLPCSLYTGVPSSLLMVPLICGGGRGQGQHTQPARMTTVRQCLGAPCLAQKAAGMQRAASSGERRCERAGWQGVEGRWGWRPRPSPRPAPHTVPHLIPPCPKPAAGLEVHVGLGPGGGVEQRVVAVGVDPRLAWAGRRAPRWGVSGGRQQPGRQGGASARSASRGSGRACTAARHAGALPVPPLPLQKMVGTLAASLPLPSHPPPPHPG